MSDSGIDVGCNKVPVSSIVDCVALLQRVFDQLCLACFRLLRTSLVRFVFSRSFIRMSLAVEVETSERCVIST